MQFNFDSFMHDANKAFMEHVGDQRYGQFMMNYLHRKHPDIEVPYDIDPFYDNSRMGHFLVFLESLSKTND